ncbi:hypothetical protein [Alkalicoccobacillus plakortidis]|uniref:DUF2157 domain-containing protein n=1 Tax=Alkalicoccobacillus plakortidis TaxID=444060 RepID=A0ABT0XPK4_9BACI|nr:hypothetical protein [Alkalicoccobacillus plakortidis]MCM2677836.1 hypothetical protein [Alkalicoccobacillus plakortidis]
MDKQRREIIINEIHYWKQTKLLPEQQCHYLLALYSEGEDELADKSDKKLGSMILWVLLTQLCFFLSVFILYFTDFVSGLQMGLVISLLLLTAITGYARRKHVFESSLHVLMTSMILFIWGLYGSLTYWQSLHASVIILIFIAIWLSVGWFWKQKIYYIIAGFMVIFLVGVVFFYQ